MKLTNAKQLEGHALHARDGVIGKVKDFYFDDHRWRIRYCVVETGTTLESRQVLISPEAIGAYDATAKMFPVALTIDQVRQSPDIDTDQPVSRQNEVALRQHYGWPSYWATDFAIGAGSQAHIPLVPVGLYTDPHFDEGPALKGDPNLRSTNDTIGYHLEARDGPIGHAKDFLIDTEEWRVRYLVVDTKNWWPGKSVVIAPGWIRGVSWDKRQIAVDLAREVIKGSPAYDPSAGWTAAYGAELHEYYRRPSNRERPNVHASSNS